jgi:hypothetical protein
MTAGLLAIVFLAAVAMVRAITAVTLVSGLDW